MVTGRVLRQELGSLPGAPLEGLWITLHSVETGRALYPGRLPQAIAEAKTGPQGNFALTRSPIEEGHELVIAVSLTLDREPLLIRQLFDAGEVTVLLPVDAQLEAELEAQ